jgi:predicted short-subunit dehydrogenase-like oxidoreductase (DUF2520 family)
MIQVNVIGSGNVAYHLMNAFNNSKEISAIQLSSRELTTIPNAAISVIAVSDDAIKSVSSHLKTRNELVVHTSGTVSMDTLQTPRKGVFYPLQSFTKGKQVDFNTIPICLETASRTDYELLESLANSIGKKIYSIDSNQRKKLHLAAVFVNNFTNHMYQVGKDICDQHQVPFEILQPLIEETAKKVKDLSPKDAQTGPAKRNDSSTIQNHLEQLNLQQQEIYKLITKSIQEH